MVKRKNKNLYRVKNKWLNSKEGTEIIFGDDRRKSIIFFNILIKNIKIEHDGKGILNPIYVSAFQVGFIYKKDHLYYIDKSLREYYDTNAEIEL